jgi:hypothetical protein
LISQTIEQNEAPQKAVAILKVESKKVESKKVESNNVSCIADGKIERG